MQHHIIKSLAVLMATCLPAVASAQNFMSGGIGYHVLSTEEHTVEVTGKQGCFLFANCPSIMNVPASVTKIEKLAFATNGLTSIDVDEGHPNYRTIDGMLFSKDSTRLQECPPGKSGSVSLPQMTREVFPYAFAYCQAILGTICRPISGGL